MFLINYPHKGIKKLKEPLLILLICRKIKVMIKILKEFLPGVNSRDATPMGAVGQLKSRQWWMKHINI